MHKKYLPILLQKSKKRCVSRSITPLKLAAGLGIPSVNSGQVVLISKSFNKLNASIITEPPIN